MSETQIRIIEAAEIEFAERGFEGASVRGITTRAGVNIAAINYHFGSKEDLFKQMLLYRLKPINSERLEMLDAANEKASGKPLQLEEVIEIIVRPLISGLIGNGCDGHHFMRAMGRGLTEEREFMKSFQKEVLSEVIPRFSEAINNSLHGCDVTQAIYTMHFLSCSMGGAMMQHGRLETLSNGDAEIADVNNMIDRLVQFIVGGITALDRFEKAK